MEYDAAYCREAAGRFCWYSDGHIVRGVGSLGRTGAGHNDSDHHRNVYRHTHHYRHGVADGHVPDPDCHCDRDCDCHRDRDRDCDRDRDGHSYGHGHRLALADRGHDNGSGRGDFPAGFADRSPDSPDPGANLCASVVRPEGRAGSCLPEGWRSGWWRWWCG